MIPVAAAADPIDPNDTVDKDDLENEPSADNPTDEASKTEEVEVVVLKPREGFKVIAVPYKLAGLKPDAEGYYNPTNKKETDELKYHVSKDHIQYISGE